MKVKDYYDYAIARSPILVAGTLALTIALFGFGEGISKNNSQTRQKEPIPGINIGKQVWMQKDLAVVIFRNGDSIQQARSISEWKNLSMIEKKPVWCYANFDSGNAQIGKLYNWFTVNDPRGLSPVGWRIPAESDYDQLIRFLGGGDLAGVRMKSKVAWASDSTGAGTDEYGLCYLPTGIVLNYGAFKENEGKSKWWTSTPSAYRWNSRALYFGESSVAKRFGYAGMSSESQDMGFAVRCILK